MGTSCSTNGEDTVLSKFKIATAPKCNDVHRSALEEQDSAAKDAWEDGALDVRSREAALAEHHLALRRFVYEWIESQEQLLSLGPKRVADGSAASSDHTRSNTEVSFTDVEVSFADVGGKPSRKPLQTKGLVGTSLPEEELTDVVAKHEIHEMFATATPTSYLKSKSQIFREREAAFGMDTNESSQDHLSAYVFQRLDSISIFLSDVNGFLQRRFPCPRLNKIEESSAFSSICGMVIVLNAITMAVSADHDMTHFQHPGSEDLRLLELIFVGIYTTEFLIRVMSKKLAFFQVAWNWFDFVIVCVGWIEVVSYYCPSLTQVRLLRILKMMKVMRVLRVMRSLREVRLLLNSLMGSVKALFWTIIIIAGMNFMFGIYFVQSLAQARHDSWKMGSGDDGQQESEHLGTVVIPWTSVVGGMYTLFKVSTGGLSWGEIADPLLQIGWQTFSIFLLYMALFMFVIINAVTAVFVSSTEEYASKDQDNLLNEQLLKKEQYVKLIFSLYQEMVGNRYCEGEVTKSVLMQYIEDPRMVSFASSLEIDSTDLKQFIDVLSSKGEHGIDMDTFVDGCIRLRGAAKSMDIYDLLIHQQSVAKEVVFIRSLLEQLIPRGRNSERVSITGN